MKKKNEKFDLISELWAPIANEYCKFLNRYKLDTIAIVISADDILDYNMRIYANPDKYLRLSLTNAHFIAEEEQITGLLNSIKQLYIIISLIDDEQDDDNQDDDDQEFEEDDDFEEFRKNFNTEDEE